MCRAEETRGSTSPVVTKQKVEPWEVICQELDISPVIFLTGKYIAVKKSHTQPNSLTLDTVLSLFFESVYVMKYKV